MNRRFLVSQLAVLLTLAVVAGCNRGPQMGAVTGVLTFSGRPIERGTVQFFPDVSGPMAAGVLDPGGAFQLTTKTPGDGAIVGDYTIVVTPPTSINELEKELRPGMPRPTRFDDIPQMYRAHTTSTLRVRVEPGKNHFELDLAEDVDS